MDLEPRLAVGALLPRADPTAHDVRQLVDAARGRAAARATRVVAQADLELLRKRAWPRPSRALEGLPTRASFRRQVDTLQAELRSATAAVTRVEVPVLSTSQIEQLTHVTATLGRIVSDLQKALTASAAPALLATTPPAPAPPLRRRARTTPAPVAAGPGLDDAPTLRSGERRMLETVVRHHPLRLTRAQLATIAGFTASGGTFGAYLGTLKRAHLLKEHADGLLPTELGFHQVGGAPKQPQTTQEIVDTWRHALRSGERRMLDLLIAARPAPMTRDELARRSGFEPTGGTFGAYLGTLRRNGLAVVAGDEVTAGDALFAAAD